MTARPALALGLAGLVSLFALSAVAAWPDWLPDLPETPDWGQDWELADLEHSLALHPPVEVERWLYNPRERTAQGLERLELRGPDEALAAFEAAARLAPGDRRVLYNSGTARLLADHGDAVEALERAVADEGERALPSRALQAAWYNLGTARLAAGEAAGAIAAFEEALRLEPSDADAKHNLEVALRRLEEERRKLLPPRESPGGERPGEDEDAGESGGTEPDEQSGDDERGGREPEGGEREAESQPDDDAAFGRRPLQGFEEQSDLTAAQAAALLEAVENLERRERLIEAARSAAQAGAEEEDW